MAKLSLAGEAEQLSKGALSGGIKMLGHWWAVPAAGVMAIFSQVDHEREKHKIKDRYEVEIGARLNKPAHEVKVRDAEKVAKQNPAIAEALQRSRRQRNLSVAVTLIGVAAAMMFGGFLAAPVLTALHISAVTAPLAAAVVTFAVNTVAFLGFETGLEKLGEHKLGLHEPNLDKVQRKPELQSKLSVPSQITFLSNMQSRGEAISEKQVMMVFASADRRLAARIQSQFGAPYEKLSEQSKQAVLKELGPQYDIAKLTEDINSRHVRAQELGFAAYGQSSGAARFDSPRITAMQKKIDDLTAQVNTLGGKAGDKLVFRNAKVSAAFIDAKGNQLDVATRQPTAQETLWRSRVGSAAQRRQLAQAQAANQQNTVS